MTSRSSLQESNAFRFLKKVYVLNTSKKFLVPERCLMQREHVQNPFLSHLQKCFRNRFTALRGFMTQNTHDLGISELSELVFIGCIESGSSFSSMTADNTFKQKFRFLFCIFRTCSDIRFLKINIFSHSMYSWCLVYLYKSESSTLSA